MGYRKLANISKSMQIHKPVVQKISICVFFLALLVKWLNHTLYFFQFQFFNTIWPSLMINKQREKILRDEGGGECRLYSSWIWKLLKKNSYMKYYCKTNIYSIYCISYFSYILYYFVAFRLHINVLGFPGLKKNWLAIGKAPQIMVQVINWYPAINILGESPFSRDTSFYRPYIVQ